MLILQKDFQFSRHLDFEIESKKSVDVYWVFKELSQIDLLVLKERRDGMYCKQPFAGNF